MFGRLKASLIEGTAPEDEVRKIGEHMRLLLLLEPARAKHVDKPSQPLPGSCSSVVHDAQQRLLDEVLASQLVDRDNGSRLEKMAMIVGVFGPVLGGEATAEESSNFKASAMFDMAIDHLRRMFTKRLDDARAALDRAVADAKESVASRQRAVDGIGVEEEDVNLTDFAQALQEVQRAVELHGASEVLGRDAPDLYEKVRLHLVDRCATLLSGAKEMFAAMLKQGNARTEVASPSVGEVDRSESESATSAVPERRTLPKRPDMGDSVDGKDKKVTASRADSVATASEKPTQSLRSTSSGAVVSRDGVKRDPAPPVPSAPPPPPYDQHEDATSAPRDGRSGATAPKPAEIDVVMHEGVLKLAEKSLTALNVVTDLIAAINEQSELSSLGVTDAVKVMAVEADKMYTEYFGLFNAKIVSLLTSGNDAVGVSKAFQLLDG